MRKIIALLSSFLVGFLFFLTGFGTTIQTASASYKYNFHFCNSYYSHGNVLVDINGTATDGHTKYTTVVPNACMTVNGALHDPYFYVASDKTVFFNRTCAGCPAGKNYGGGYWIHDGTKWDHNDVSGLVSY